MATITGTSLSFTATCKDINGEKKNISENYPKCVYSEFPKCPVKSYNYKGSCSCLNRTTGQSYAMNCSDSKPNCSAACYPNSFKGKNCEKIPLYSKCYHPE